MCQVRGNLVSFQGCEHTHNSDEVSKCIGGVVAVVVGIGVDMGDGIDSEDERAEAKPDEVDKVGQFFRPVSHDLQLLIVLEFLGRHKK